MNFKCGMRGPIPVEACGRTLFAHVSSEFVELMKALLVSRLLCRNTQGIEEDPGLIIIYIYMYIYYIYIHRSVSSYVVLGPA
jgi:hypothetical protein